MQAEPTPHRAERKRATILFADIVGFTALSERMGPEEAYSLVTGCLKLLDGVARKHGGSVDKYLGDALMVVFGHPLPLDDDAGAAVEAALEMRRRVHEYNQELRLELPLETYVGVNTGSVIAGDIRGPVIREFHVLGDAVNVAARLKQRAPKGRIYVGPETYEATRARFEYVPLEPMQLKGKSVRVATFELVRARQTRRAGLGSDQLAFSTLVGRAPELASLRDRRARLARGEGGVVTLLGEEGIGKSRLVAELAGEESGPGITWLEAHASAVESERALHPFADLVRGWAGIEEADDAASARAKLEAALGDAPRSELLPAFSGLCGLAPATTGGRLRRRERASSRGPAAPALARWLGELARERPIALVFENLQWADPASLEALGELLPLTASCPILIIVLARPGLSPPARDLLARAAALAERHGNLELGALDPAASRELVERLVGEGGISDAARAMVEARGAGNPRRLVTGVFLAPALESESRRAAQERSGETERRRATVLFADITGFTRLTETLGDEPAYGVVADALALLDEAARKYGGTVDKYLGDCVLALFGVPEAIEDAPRAAVNAAIEMRQRIHEFSRVRQLSHPLDVHSGINTGLGIAGDVSGPMLREFAVMGESVDVANRLADLAPAGRIFVGAETHRFTANAFEYRPAEPAEGKAAAPPGVHEVLSEQPQLYRRAVGIDQEIFSELVGREKEIGELRRRLAEVAAGRGGMVALVGEAGLGKSRLTAELRGYAEAEPVVWLEGRSLSIGSQLSYHPFADLLRAWAGISDEDGEGEIPTKLGAALTRLLPDEADEIFPFLATVMGVALTPEQEARLEAVQGELVEKLIRERLTRVLQRISEERPLVLVFDDLHWADLSSIELLESLQRLAATRPILFLHVCRPHFGATSERILDAVRKAHAERYTELPLAPLDHEAIRQLINNLFRHADIPHRVRTLIAEKAGGNPFYVEEVVRSLVEEGAVERHAGGFRATEKIHGVVIPGTVQEVIMARVDRLSLRQKEAIQVASVVGRSFHFEVLRQIFPDKDALMADLQALQDAGFIVPWDRLQGVEFAFKHPLIQEVAYDSLLQKRREELHLAVGNAIEAALTENVPGYHGMLAYHFSLGRDLERAEEALFRAGDDAARSAASNEALHFFREASKLYFDMHGEGGDPRKKANLERNIALALFNRGQQIEAVDHFNAALRYLGQPVPKNELWMGLRFVRDMLGLLAQWYVLGGRRRRAASPAQLELIHTMFRRSVAETTTAPTRFVFDTMATLRKISKLDPPSVPEYGGMYSGAVGIFSYGGINFALGEKVLEIARRAIDEEGSPELYFNYLAMNHVHHFLRGDWEPQHEIAQELIDENYRAGRLWEVVTYLGFHAEQLFRRGDFAAARERIQQMDAIWETYDYDWAKTQHYYLPTILLLEQRRLPEAKRAADAYYQENPEDLLHLLALGMKAQVQTLLGELDEAEESLAKGAEIVRRTRYPIPFHLSAYLTARFLLDLVRLEASQATGDRVAVRGLRRQARRSGKAAEGIAAKVGYRKPEIFRLKGRRAWLVGRHSEALHWWERSLEESRRLATRPEQARTAHEVGVRLATSRRGPRELAGRDAASWLDEARALYGELGLEWDLARLEGQDPP